MSFAPNVVSFDLSAGIKDPRRSNHGAVATVRVFRGLILSQLRRFGERRSARTGRTELRSDRARRGFVSRGRMTPDDSVIQRKLSHQS